MVDFNIVATRFEQITFVHYQMVSDTENQYLQSFLRSKKLLKITKT